MAKRIDPYATKEQIVVAMHNHSVDKPGEFATAQSLLDAMAGDPGRRLEPGEGCRVLLQRERFKQVLGVP